MFKMYIIITIYKEAHSLLDGIISTITLTTTTTIIIIIFFIGLDTYADI